MICPACQSGLPVGPHERCPFCGTLLGAPTQGALAAEPMPEARARPEPLREIPALRKRERTWKDEVRERVRQRRQDRLGQNELPLFGGAEAAEPDEAVPGDEPAPAPEASLDRHLEPELDPVGDLPLRAAADPVDTDLEPEPARVAPALAAAPTFAGAPDAPGVDIDEREPETWSLGASEPAPQPDWPLERPAAPGERAQAAVVDGALLASLFALIVYFASRTAHVTVAGLRPSWLYLALYLGALGLLYAGYFTGTTGQTLGKIAVGLRVVNASGRPPGYLRASLRALLGSLGVLLAFSGVVPVFLDPARRGLHDRLLKTRVVFVKG